MAGEHKVSPEVLAAFVAKLDKWLDAEAPKGVGYVLSLSGDDVLSTITNLITPAAVHMAARAIMRLQEEEIEKARVENAVRFAIEEALSLGGEKPAEPSLVNPKAQA